MGRGALVVAAGLMLAANLAGALPLALDSWDIGAASKKIFGSPGHTRADPDICPASSSDFRDKHQLQQTRTDEQSRGDETQWQDDSQQQALRQALDEQLSVVLVLDPPSRVDYEPVPVTGLTKAGLLPWVANLSDALTVTDGGNGTGLPLQVEDDYKSYFSSECRTFAECVSEAVKKDDAARAAATAADEERQPVIVRLPSMLLVAYHMTQFAADVTKGTDSISYILQPDKLRFTTVRSFYEAAEATAVANENVTDAEAWRCVSSWNASTDQPLGTIAGLGGSVLVLPRMVPVTTDPWRTTITNRRSPTSKWTPQLVFGFVQKFVAAAQVKTVPTLDEWWLIADKIWLDQQWHRNVPKESQHTAQILEVVPVEVPLNEKGALAACWSQEQQPEADVQATMKVIFKGLQALHLKIKPDSVDRSIMTPEGPDTMQSYILKRTFTEGGRDMLFFDFPTSALVDVNSSAPWLASRQGSKPTTAEANATDTTEASPPLLDHVARHIIRRGCTAKWILQFMIKDFALSEYHFYLPNAADAGPGDAWMAYRPTVQNHDPSSTQLVLKIATVTIPRGHFASELLPDWESDEHMHETLAAAEDAAGELPPGPLKQTVRQIDGNWLQKTWPSPRMYEKLLGIALNGIDRFTSGRTEDGKLLLPVLHKTFARMDIGAFLTWNETRGRHEVVMRVNEFAFINDASILCACWDTSPASLAAGVCSRNSHNSSAGPAGRSRTNAWEEPCTDATPQQLREAMVASQSASLAAAYGKALLRQVAWTALDVRH